ASAALPSRGRSTAAGAAGSTGWAGGVETRPVMTAALGLAASAARSCSSVNAREPGSRARSGSIVPLGELLAERREGANHVHLDGLDRHPEDSRRLGVGQVLLPDEPERPPTARRESLDRPFDGVDPLGLPYAVLGAARSWG